MFQSPRRGMGDSDPRQPWSPPRTPLCFNPLDGVWVIPTYRSTIQPPKMVLFQSPRRGMGDSDLPLARNSITIKEFQSPRRGMGDSDMSSACSTLKGKKFQSPRRGMGDSDHPPHSTSLHAFYLFQSPRRGMGDSDALLLASNGGSVKVSIP